MPQAMEKGDETFLAHFRPDFDTMIQAATVGRLAMVEATDRATGHKVATICAVNFVRNDQGEVIAYDFVPLARMLTEGDFKYLTPPEGTDVVHDGPVIDPSTAS